MTEQEGQKRPSCFYIRGRGMRKKAVFSRNVIDFWGEKH